MIEKTEGIVLHSIKYSESDIIVHVYTELFGISTCMVRHARGSRSKMALYRPLSILQIELYKKKSNDIYSIKNATFSEVFVSTPNDIYKSSIALLIGEFLYKLCKNEEKNIELYNYLKDFILFLEYNHTNYADAYLQFLLKMSSFWGIYPEQNFSNNNVYFNTRLGKFCDIYDAECATKEISELVHRMMLSNDYNTSFNISRTIRMQTLHTIVQYYSLHVHNVKILHSLKIFETIFA